MKKDILILIFILEKEKRVDEILLEKKILQENIEKLNVDVENEQKRQIEKKEMFVEDLDAQIEEKGKLSTKEKGDQKKSEQLRVEMLWDQRVRDKNEMAQRLSKWSFDSTDTTVTAVILAPFYSNINSKNGIFKCNRFLVVLNNMFLFFH